jgi:tRNA threonylcarbamoyladenosine biosynthesis protein TsaB
MTEPALTLAIETSNPASGGEPGVAVGLTTPDAAQALGLEHLGRGDRHDDLLMPAVERLLARLGHAPRDLTRVAVSIGPGGYTALRIATAAASMIAMATGASLVGVPSAHVAARRAPRGRPFAVALASKNDSTVLTPFDAEGRPAGPPRLLTAANLDGAIPGTLIADRHLPEPIRAAALAAGCRIIEPNFDPTACLELAWSAAPAVSIMPLYGREPEAVTRWRELHPRPNA